MSTCSALLTRTSQSGGLSCSDTKLDEAAVVAYRSLGVRPGEEATSPVVVLCDERYSSNVMAALAAEGAPVQGYYYATERPGLQKFLASPTGVLCTEAETFSGMEAARIIWVQKEASGERGAVMRAVERVATVSIDTRAVTVFTPGSVEVHTGLAECDTGYDSYYSCSSCHLAVCGHCAQICHQTCTDGTAKTAVEFTVQRAKCVCATGQTRQCRL